VRRVRQRANRLAMKSDLSTKELKKLKRLLEKYHKDLYNRHEDNAAREVYRVIGYVEDDIE